MPKFGWESRVGAGYHAPPLRAGLGEVLDAGRRGTRGEEREEMNNQNSESTVSWEPGIWTLPIPPQPKREAGGLDGTVPTSAPPPPLQILVINRGLPVEGTGIQRSQVRR